MNDFGDGPKLRTADVRPNIHEHVGAICDQLGLPPTRVKELRITPNSVTATVYRLDQDGARYVDLESNTAPTDTLTFKVHA